MSRVETAPVGKTVSWLPPLDGGTLLMVFLIGAMGFYILYPLALILLNNFNVATIAQPPAYALQAWKEAFSEAAICRDLWNSAKIGAARQVIALPMGIFTASVLSRTNIY